MADKITTILASGQRGASEVIASLHKYTRDVRMETENYNYVLGEIFKKSRTFDGTKVYTYTELQAGTTDSPYADSKIADFNGSIGKIAREEVEAKREVNLKTKVMDSALANFKVNPSDGIVSFIATSTNIVKMRDKTFEQDLWKTLDNEITTIDTATAPDVANKGDSVVKQIYTKLLKLQTTSKKHVGVGKNGVITCTNGVPVSPALNFSPKDFVVISSPAFAANIAIDGDRSFFNWNGSKIETGKTIILDLENYEPVDGLTFKNIKPAEFKAMLIHKDLLDVIEDWTGSKLVNTAKLYSILHNYIKYNVYRLKNKPAFVFQGTGTKTP